MEIHVLKARNLSVREIARRLGISRNTVSRYLASGDVLRYKDRASRPTKIGPYAEFITLRIEAAAPDVIAAPALLRELRSLGYTGRLRVLQSFMQGHKPGPRPDPVVRFETNPGQQMQCDFVVFRRGRNPLYAFTATLGYSRWRWVRFTTDEKADTLLACHHALFETLDGVPCEILYDCQAQLNSEPVRFEYEAGAIKQPEIKNRVVQILEGTEPAFKNRQSKYRLQ